MTFNINDNVKIRLTDFGRQYLKTTDQDWRLTPGCGNVETNGWSTWQLWDLMATFGPMLMHGGTLPFETTIEIL